MAHPGPRHHDSNEESSWKRYANMRMRSKLGLATVAAGILLIAVLVFVFVSETVLPFTDHLRQDALAGDGEHTVRFFQDEDEDKVASVYVRHGQAEGDLYRMMVEVWHRNETILDSLSLEFKTVRPASALMLETPEGYPWPPFEYRSALGPGRTAGTGGVIVNIPDLEFQGRGTVTLVFHLRTDVLTPAPPEKLRLDVAFSMHREGLPRLTRQEGEATILIELAQKPTAGVTLDELFADPGQYNGTDILLEGFYFDGWETTVLSERLELTGQAEGHLWPRGRMVWIENNLILAEVYDQLYQQEMIGPLERYAKLRIRGRFEHGGRYGHVGGFTAQIVPTEVELLPWSPAPQQPDHSDAESKLWQTHPYLGGPQSVSREDEALHGLHAALGEGPCVVFDRLLDGQLFRVSQSGHTIALAVRLRDLLRKALLGHDPVCQRPRPGHSLQVVPSAAQGQPSTRRHTCELGHSRSESLDRQSDMGDGVSVVGVDPQLGNKNVGPKGLNQRWHDLSERPKIDLVRGVGV